MDINALYNYLQGMLPSLWLKTTDTNLPAEFRAFIETIPGRSIVIDAGTNGLQLQGQLLTISGSCTDQWPVEGLTGVTLTLSSIIITVDASQPEVNIHGVAQAQMPFSTTNIAPVSVTSQQGNGYPWMITLNNDVSGITPMQVILFGNVNPLPFDIPPGMDFLTSVLTVDPSKYSITFFPNTLFESQTKFVLTAPAATWNPVPGIFAFNGLDITGTVKTSSFGVVIVGHLVIGSVQVDVGISMSSLSDWYVFLQPTPPAEAFPGLADLAGWIGGSALTTSMNSGFTSVDISTSGFDAAISYVGASVDVATSKLNFLIIKSILTIGALQLDVNMRLPQLQINGNLHNQQPLKVTDLLASLSLPTATVPADLLIATANFSANLNLSNYSILLEVQNLWQAGPFSFDLVKLGLGYSSVIGLTGNFSCQFTIAEAAILLNAEYGGQDAGWIFGGGLKPGTTLEIGDIITMLASDFGIGSVPEPIRSLKMTELWVTYASAKNSFVFTCSGGFTVDDRPVTMSIDIELSQSATKTGGVPGTNGYHAYFGGTITIDNYIFSLVFDTTNFTTNTFIAAFRNTNTGNVPLKQLVAGVSTSVSAFIPPSLVIDLEQVKFIYYKQDDVSQFAFGLQFSASIDLRDLPVIGDKLPEGLTMGVDKLQVLFANANFSQDQVSVINPLLPEGITPLLAKGVAKGLMISGNLDIVGYLLPINTGTEQQKPQAVSDSFDFTGTLDTSTTAVEPSDITWFNVQKQLGPMNFQRIGVAFANNVLSFALDASLTLGPANLSMQGLTVGSPLNTFAPVFGIQGFFMDIKTPGFELGGGFLRAKTPDGATAYYGAVMVQVGSFSLQALGGDVPAHEAQDPAYPNDPTKKIHIPASFFIYANVELPIGGPPYLYVNGFAGGFGINNLLKLPTLDNLPGYILLPGPGSKAPAAEATPEQTINKVLPQMQRYFIPQPGQYWVAAGIAFSSFEMINAFALVTVSFGVDFQIALLGSCSMNFPTAATDPIAYVEIDIMASYATSTGLLAVEGILSPASYIFGSFCKLTGGFAFYIWINPPATDDGPKAGDFVVTLGGYHPAYVPPDYYPSVPRLGINFGLGPFQVIGKSYFALTPGMFMAGGSLNATWNLDIVKAWFTLGCDFLIAWAPFHYEAVVYVSIGCSVNMGLFTLNVSVGADVEIWGPPFGGVAHVDLDVISFTISFGEDKTPPPPVGWADFKSQFLPADTPVQAKASGNNQMLTAADTTPQTTTNILKATVVQGLNGAQVDGQDWILDSDHFNVQLSSTIPTNVPRWATATGTYKDISNDPTLYNILPPPVTAAAWPYLVFTDTKNQMSSTEIWNSTVNIKPMGLSGVTSTLSVSLVRMDNTGVFSNYETALTLMPVVGDVPAALWQAASGQPLSVNDPAFLLSALNGFNITPIPRTPNVVNEVLLIQLLYQQGNNYYFNYQQRVIDTAYTVTSEETTTNNSDGSVTDTLSITVSGAHSADLSNINYVLNSLADPWVTGQRNVLLANLNQIGFDTYSEAVLTTFCTETALTDWPEVLLLADTLPQP